MIRKWYEVSCDACGHGIRHYSGKRPTPEMLKRDGIIQDGSMHYCSPDCREYLLQLINK